jgi:phage gpG-like protein
MPPTRRDVRRSIMGGLNIRGALDRSAVVGITFEPTIGIAAGRIATLGLKISDFKEPLEKAIRLVIIPSIQQNFRVGGRPEWEPLAEYTLKRRRDEGYGLTPLVKTGNLERTMTRVDIWTITKSMAILADLPQDAWYGAIHQKGYEGAGGGRLVRQGRRKTINVLDNIVDNARASAGQQAPTLPPIPARPFVVLQPEDEDKIMLIFIKWLEKQVLLAWPGVPL